MAPRRTGIGTLSLVVVVVLIIVIGTVAFVLYGPASPQQPPPTTTSQTIQTTLSPNPGGSSTSANTSVVSAPTNSTGVANGSFRFSPASPVRIDGVQAIVQQTQGGPDSLTFTVAFTNVGTFPITVVGACFSPLEVSPPANSTVVQSATGTFVQCEAISCNSINPGQSSEASTDTWQGPGPAPHLILVNPGTVTITLVLYWGTDNNSCTGPSGGPDSTSISATFSFV